MKHPVSQAVISFVMRLLGSSKKELDLVSNLPDSLFAEKGRPVN